MDDQFVGISPGGSRESSRHYEITGIDVVTRQDADQVTPRKNFEVWASDDVNFTFPVLLGTQDDTPLAFKGTWQAELPDPQSYRYVRFVKTKDYAVVAELRILARSLSD